MVKISVAMATYNGGQYLKEQLDSILNQSYPVSEIIIVDDGSSDSTIEIITNYQKICPILKLIQNTKNLGVVKTFENAVSNCSGDYILFSDQDDVWFNNKVEVLLNNIDDNLLIYSDAIIVDQNLKLISNSNLSHFEAARDFSVFRDYLFGNNVTGCTMMIHRDLLINTLPIPEFEIMYHDQYFALCAAYMNKVKKITHPLLFYRQHDKNLSASYDRLNYLKIVYNLAAMSNDIDLVMKCSFFKSKYNLVNDFKLAIYFFKAMAHKKYPSIELFFFCKKEFSNRMFFWFIRMACMGKWFAELNYNLAPLKSKIKQLFNNVK